MVWPVRPGGIGGNDVLMEARVGIEPTHKGFADLSLTTWVPRLSCGGLQLPERA